ncbi:PDF receptor-like [Mytilus trossulus]|uniref:PDF receptor-like n=1 Tax=Mytilus trossulus TaxID=6551 RepID=UPI0030065098
MVKFEKFPSTLMECLDSQGDALTVPSNLFCNATWDTILCWPPTLIGSITKLPCPGKHETGLERQSYASKECGLDGNWIGIHPGKETFPEEFEPGWTNYSECIGVIYETVKNTSDNIMNVSESASVSVGALSIPHNGADIFGAALLVLSLILILASLGITCCNNAIQSTRTRFYRNLFAAFIFHDVLELIVRIGRVFHSDAIIRDIETCVSFGVLLTLLSTAIFSWFLMIGISFMLTFKGVVVENRMYYVMCLLGWFMPTVVTITWLSVTVLGGNLSCWDGELYIARMTSSFWIIQGSIVIFLLFTWLCILSFLLRYKEWEMQRKYSENKDLAVELTNIKQSGYKMFATMCFMTGAYIIYLSCSQSPLTESLSYLLVLVMFSRGIIVAVFMCFLEEQCKCWDGMYAVEGSTTTDSESLSSRNSSHPSHYGHHTVLPNHGIISM